MGNVRKVYWDSGIFIGYLSGSHQRERLRADIATDILNHAREGNVEIWTSVWTIAEVIRPKSPIPDSFPLPKWAELLNATDEKGQVPFPKAGDHFKRIWDYHERHAREARLLPEADARRIRQMFDWPWIRKIDVVPKIAHEATEIMRTHNMRAGDAIHVASAVHRNCDALQRWDKDFTKTDGLIPSEEPSLLTQSDGKGPSLFD